MLWERTLLCPWRKSASTAALWSPWKESWTLRTMLHRSHPAAPQSLTRRQTRRPRQRERSLRKEKLMMTARCLTSVVLSCRRRKTTWRKGNSPKARGAPVAPGPAASPRHPGRSAASSTRGSAPGVRLVASSIQASMTGATITCSPLGPSHSSITTCHRQWEGDQLVSCGEEHHLRTFWDHPCLPWRQTT